MNKTLLALTTTVALALSSNVMAEHKKHDRHGHKQQVLAKVVHVEPIFKTVRVALPVKQCWREEDRHNRNHRVHYVAPEKVILGGLIGGAIGHELGRNHNQALSTLTGAVIGTAIAHTTNSQRYDEHYEHNEWRHDRGDYRHQHNKHCRTEYRYRTESQLQGYRVTYRYAGEFYDTRTHKHPGKWIPINIEVKPAKRHHRH